MANDPISQYAEVIVPLAIAGTFTYRIPLELMGQAGQGSRVIVPFGKKKYYTGIIAGFAPGAPQGYEVKDIISVLDPQPVLRHPQLRLWEWMAEYYLCGIGEVYKCAVPSGLKIESETAFEVNPDIEAEDAALLPEKELMVWQLLKTKGKLDAHAIEKETGFRNVTALMHRAVQHGAAIVSESLVDRYRPKREKCVRIAFARGDEEALRSAFAAVKGAPKQEAMLMTLIHLSQFTLQAKPLLEVTQEELLERCNSTTTILKALVDKGLAERYTREISRFGVDNTATIPIPALTEAQSQALQGIHDSFKSKAVTLLFGPAASGKTEIYAHLADYILRQGNQVLMLVPEIALTTQLTQRLRQYFGSRMLVYHSKFSDSERVEIWNKLLHTNEPYLVLGVRSAVFLPFAKLGLVIVDEEHDSSYKQFDPAPRFNGRDTAIMLAHMHGAKTLLGSATPSIESYYKATSGKYALVTLSERYGNPQMPVIEVVDMAKEYKKKTVNGTFASPTISTVRQAVADGKQALIFLNKRGFAPMARCTKCQYIPKCQYCDVALTYHKRSNQLVCHYCGTVYPLSDTCPACKEPALELVGYGTERVQDDIQEAFPDARILRMDLDTTRNKNSYQSLIDQFSDHKADILVGTQMITKGLDFGAVAVAAVVNADKLINIPDFRSAERAFCMLMQVAGRAGRREAGRVLVQTRDPEHAVIKFLQAQDYLGFYSQEIEERRAFAYPPFTRLIIIYLKHRDEIELDNLAANYAARLRQLFGNRVQGPAKPGVARVQNLYIRQVMLKIELNASMQKVKEILRGLEIEIRTRIPAARAMKLYYDVDPN